MNDLSKKIVDQAYPRKRKGKGTGAQKEFSKERLETQNQ